MSLESYSKALFCDSRTQSKAQIYCIDISFKCPFIQKLLAGLDVKRDILQGKVWKSIKTYPYNVMKG